MSLIKETAEISSKSNTLMNDLISKGGLSLLAFEGYTIKDDRVSALFDRRKSEKDLNDWTPDSILNEVITSETPIVWNAKKRCSIIMGAPYYIVLYTDTSERVNVYLVKGDSLILTNKFVTLREFADWTMTLRSHKMMSRFETNGLPIFDVKLRNLGIPWPGNFDGVWFDPNTNKILAILEFSVTYAVSVTKHCHNIFFKATSGRKGDAQRWLVLDIPRKQLNCPLIIIVWSPNEEQVKLKVVDHIKYEGPDQGLYYKEKIMVKKSDVLAKLREMVIQ